MTNILALSGSYVALIIILAVLFACFIAGLTALLVTAKKRSKNEKTAVEDNTAEEESVEEAESEISPTSESEPEAAETESDAATVETEKESDPATVEEEKEDAATVVEDDTVNIAPAEVYIDNAPATEETSASDESSAPAEEKSAEESDAAEPETEDEIETADRSVVVLGERRILVQYNRSFLAKLIQADDVLQSRYGILKNELLSYNKVKSRISWTNDSFRYGRPTVAKFAIRGKTLSLYLAIDPATLEDTKYKYEDAGDVKKYQAVPTRLKLKSDRSVKYAVELISQMMTAMGSEKGEPQSVDYSLPYESTEKLIDRKLIKVIATNENGEEITDLTTEEIVNVPSEKFRLRTGMTVRESVTVEEAHATITDEVAATFVEKAEPTVTKKSAVTRTGKKGIINVDVLSAHFNSGDVVDLETLKSNGLIAKNTGNVKVLARGTLDKALTVKAQDFSIDAVKMIIIVGGQVIQES